LAFARQSLKQALVENSEFKALYKNIKKSKSKEQVEVEETGLPVMKVSQVTGTAAFDTNFEQKTISF
jgi:hypothetical protein